MKKRLAIVRGPNLNSWEMQNFSPLIDTFDIVGFTSYGYNFDVDTIPFEVRKLFSFGQFLRARFLRKPMDQIFGDYHDLWRLGRALRDFDIVHCAETSYYYTYQAAKAKKNNNFKLVVTVWENIPFLHHLPATDRCKQEIFSVTDLFLPTSERAKEVLVLEGVPEEKIRIQMPGIDIEHFHPMSKDPELLRQFDCTEDDFVILFVANLYREKGIYDLIFAFRSLLNRLGEKSRLKLLIAGRGKEEKNIKSWIGKLHLEHHTRLIGSYPYTMMPKIHNLADIFVLPSLPIPTWQEQFGYVLVESMSCGKSVISTLNGSIPEVIGSAGILVQPNDFVSITDSLEALFLNPGQRDHIGKSARKRIEDYFDVRIVSQKYKQQYRELF